MQGSRIDDQATRLRELVSALRAAPAQPETVLQPEPAFGREPPRQPARQPKNPVIAITSGKGGVGKTCLGVNLAVAMATLGARPVLLDADLGAANADVLLGVSPRRRLSATMGARGVIDLAPLATPAPAGVNLVAGLTGGEPDAMWRRRVIGGLWTLDAMGDSTIVDTGGGLGEGVRAFLEPASAVVVVTTPEPTAIADAYGLIKLICAKSAVDAGVLRPERIGLVVNMASSIDDGRQTHARIARVADRFLGVQIPLWGVVPRDPEAQRAVLARSPLVLAAPDSPASVAITQLARGLMARFMDSDALAE